MTGRVFLMLTAVVVRAHNLHVTAAVFGDEKKNAVLSFL